MCSTKQNHYTEAEKAFISENFGKMSYSEIAEKLNRTAQSVRHYCYQVKLASVGSKPRWSNEDRDYLRANHPTHTNAQLAKKLGRSVGAVAAEVKRIRSGKRSPKTKQNPKVAAIVITKSTPAQLRPGMRKLVVTGNRTVHTVR